MGCLLCLWHKDWVGYICDFAFSFGEVLGGWGDEGMRIHWFSFTVHASEEHGRALWAKHLHLGLGDPVSTERKGRGFENISVGLQEAKFYFNPIQQKPKEDEPETKKKVEYYHIEIPGSACDCLVPSVFSDIVDDLKYSGLRWSVKRIDIAWDNVPFLPVEFFNAVCNNFVVSLAKRETLSLVQTPFEIREDASGFGCDTCYIGSKESQRFVRVYNQRGFNRLEFVCRDERAHVVALDIFSYAYQDWDLTGREHLVQYITFSEEFSQWHKFIGFAKSADIKISSARLISLSSMQDWFERQVSVSLSVWFEVWGERTAMHKLKDIISKAERRDRSRYSAVLQLTNAGGLMQWPDPSVLGV